MKFKVIWHETNVFENWPEELHLNNRNHFWTKFYRLFWSEMDPATSGAQTKLEGHFTDLVSNFPMGKRSWNWPFGWFRDIWYRIGIENHSIIAFNQDTGEETGEPDARFIKWNRLDRKKRFRQNTTGLWLMRKQCPWGNFFKNPEIVENIHFLR